jgi:hypothetical protein
MQSRNQSIEEKAMGGFEMEMTLNFVLNARDSIHLLLYCKEAEVLPSPEKFRKIN